MADWYATASELRDAIARKALSAEEACRAALARIDAVNGRLNAFRSVDAERALSRARELDARREPAGPLHGVPVALKDNIVTSWGTTCAGSQMLADYTAPYDATVVRRLEAAGAVLIGKTNCDEFAMGSGSEHCAFGPVKNPFDETRIPGGSSGGSAVAVSAGMTPLALGSDTGGSVRQPAAFCGVVGVKPTYGRVSRYGLIAFASSLDQIGPFSHTVRDAALCLEIVSGDDPRDATATSQPVPAFTEALTGDIRGLRVGVPRDLVGTGLDGSIQEAFEESLRTLQSLGAEVRDVTLPFSRFAVPVYYLVATAEASSNLARFDGVRYGFRAPDARTLDAMYDRTRDLGFGAEVKRRIMLGTYVLSAGYYDAYYLKAQQVRTLIRRDFERAFESVDVIATPTSPVPPFKIGEKAENPIEVYLADVFTVSAPLAGLPAMSVPCGYTAEGLPIGLHLTGRAWQEATLLRAGDAYERATIQARQRPAL